MSAARSYRTIARSATAEIEVKRSRFVADVARVESEDAARAHIERIRAASRDARHHCTAFVLGPDAATQRSNDDGEPSGTAGPPMLEVLRGHDLTDVVAVVTRWFGGTLLGTGGLIRAYSEAVSAVIEVAGIVTREERLVVLVDVTHADGPRVEHALREDRTSEVADVEYLGTGVRVHVAVEPGRLDELTGLVAALTSGAGVATVGGTTWVDAPGPTS